MSSITTKKFSYLLIIILLIFVISRIFKVLKINQSNLQIDIHYSNLEQLLIEQNWGKADYETSLLMQEITNQNRHILYGIERFILKEELLALIDYHPIFTGVCPQCKHKFYKENPPLIHWDCPVCSWIDDSV